MVEYSGLVKKYRTNRKLSKLERERQFQPLSRIPGDTLPQLTPIRLNSTFLEVVDKYFAPKGILTWYAISTTAISMYGLIGGVAAAVKISASAWSYPVILLFCSILPAATWWAALKEMNFTHYPVRFNRKNRTVYALRFDGTVMRANWDQLFFTIGTLPTALYEIQMHRLAEDRCTVLETVGLGLCTPRSGFSFLAQFWEFHRRYMEEGPEDAGRRVQIFQDIAARKATIPGGISSTAG